MKLFRSIGTNELMQLINGSTVHGRYNCEGEKLNNCELKNMCCFFVDEVMWKDKQHSFLVVVDIPEEDIYFGNGIYNATKNFANTKVWSGRWGDSQYSIREAYCDSYSLSQVKEIYLFGHYTSSFVNDVIMPKCNEYGVVLHHMDMQEPFANSKQVFTKDSDGIYKTAENYNGWEKKFEINEEIYIENTKKLILNAEISLVQAKKIRSIINT